MTAAPPPLCPSTPPRSLRNREIARSVGSQNSRSLEDLQAVDRTSNGGGGFHWCPCCTIAPRSCERWEAGPAGPEMVGLHAPLEAWLLPLALRLRKDERADATGQGRLTRKATSAGIGCTNNVA